jgi:hemolysin III
MDPNPTPIHLRPTWRGWIHIAAFFMSIPAGTLLLVNAHRASARVAAAIYIATLLAVFGVSGAYHRFTKTERAQMLFQRLDHGMIYLLIAGSLTPICLLGLPPAWGIPMLALAGAEAVFGLVLTLAFYGRLPRIAGGLYLVMGWGLVIAMPTLSHHVSGWVLGLILAGGAAYTVGFPVLMFERPDPWPRKFGFHEIWHALTVIAGGCHFAAVAMLVAR